MRKTRIYFVVILVAITIFGVFGWTRQGQTSSRVVWEYKSVYISQKDYLQAEDILNRAGAEGWEIVFFEKASPTATSDVMGRYFFKRPK